MCPQFVNLDATAIQGNPPIRVNAHFSHIHNRRLISDVTPRSLSVVLLPFAGTPTAPASVGILPIGLCYPSFGSLDPGCNREVGYEMGSYVSHWFHRPGRWPSGGTLEIGYFAKHRHHVDFDRSRNPDRHWHHEMGSYVSHWFHRPGRWPSGGTLEIGYFAKHRHHVDFDRSRNPDRHWHH